MGLLGKVTRWLKGLLKKKHLRIGIYGPPNAGKTTLANRITRDWVGELMGSVSEVPHETRAAVERKEVIIQTGDSTVTFDIIDTPGVATKVDFHRFVEDHGFDEDEGRQRAKEATEGVIEAIRWLDEVEGVLLVMDASGDPYTQLNVTMIGNLQARKLPVLIIANKIDIEEASPASIRAAYPQHLVVPLSALAGYNIDNLYKIMVKYFG